MKGLTRKQVADTVGVSIEAVRFYEREGLIEAPPRSESNYRQYPPEAIIRIRFIKRAQGLGFSLPEIKELMSLKMTAGTTAADIRQRAVSKIENIESKIQALQNMKRVLKDITDACHGQGALSACPILEALEK